MPDILSIELCKGLHAIEMVGHAARFTATVHGEDGIAHVDTAERDRRGEDVAKRTATCHVAMVDKPLTRHTCLAANLREDGSRHGIARIFPRLGRKPPLFHLVIRRCA